MSLTLDLARQMASLHKPSHSLGHYWWLVVLPTDTLILAVVPTGVVLYRERKYAARVHTPLSWNSTGKIRRIGRHLAENPNVEVTMCLGPMPPDASDFPGGIPALLILKSITLV